MKKGIILFFILAAGFCAGAFAQTAEELNNSGLAYFNQGDLDRAIEDLNKAIQLDPHFAKAYINRGRVYAYKGGLVNFTRSIADLNQAILLNPNDAEAYRYRGFTYEFEKEYDKAIADYDQAIFLNPDYFEAYYHRGFVYLQKKDFEHALADFEAVLRLKPDGYLGARYYLERARQLRDSSSTLPDAVIEGLNKAVQDN